MPDSPSHEQLVALVERLNAQVVELAARNAELERVVAAQAEEITELKRRLSSDSSNSSRPPSSDAPWGKQPAKPRSSRGRSGRKPGKQPGSGSSSRALVADPDRIAEIVASRCRGCCADLGQAPEHARERRQVVDVRPAPPPEITEYQRVSKRCTGCGTVTTPNWDTDDPAHAEIVAAAGSPVRIGPEALARAALLTCAHYLPIGRSRDLLEALTGIDVSTGFLAGIEAAPPDGWREVSCRICKPCWPAPRCCTQTKPPAAPPVPWPTYMWPAPNTSH